ncbi:MAG: Rdx family protein [Dehalococcoidia bacterium]
MEPRPTLTITYCTLCRFEARATWLAQELLHTFSGHIAGVMIVPGSGGVLDIKLDDEMIFSRHAAGRDPVIKEVRDALYARLSGLPERPHGL